MPFYRKTNEKTSQLSVNTQKIFIGRKDELAFFTENILKPDYPSHNIISIAGNGGVGKSTLIARLIDEVRTLPFKDYCLTAFINEQQSTPFNIMEKIADQLSEVGFPLTEFNGELNQYKETIRKLQIEREASQETAIRGTVDLVGAAAEEVPVIGSFLHKGANVVTELYLKDRHIHQQLKDAELLENALSNLTKIFVEELNRLADKQVPLSINRLKRSQRIILDAIANVVYRSAQRKRAKKRTHDITNMMRSLRQTSPESERHKDIEEAEVLSEQTNAPRGENQKELPLHQLETLAPCFLAPEAAFC